MKKIPDQLLTIDFESHYAHDYSLSHMTTESYIRDPRFETIGCAVKLNDEPAEWFTADQFKAFAAEWDWQNTAVLAHHAHFDGLILSHHYRAHPGFWFDTLSMARALHGTEVGNSLRDLMPKYGVGEKGVEVVAAQNKRLANFTPEELARYARYCENDTEGAYGIFVRMLQAGFPEKELRAIDLTVRMFTQPTLMLDRPRLEAYLKQEKAKKLALMRRVAGATEADSDALVLDMIRPVLMSNAKFAKVLELYDVEAPTKVSPTTGESTFAFAKSDAGMQELLDHETDVVRWLAEARLAIKSTINETRTERFLNAGAGGRPVPVYLKFAPAHTHRWGGGDRMNFQNLQRGGEIRHSLLAPPGHVLVVADSAQIEARVLAWLADHKELLAAFAEGRDVYSEFATKAYGRKISKHDKVERQVGKVAILGLGYGLGWSKFASILLAGPMGAPPIRFLRSDAATLKADLTAFESTPEYLERMRTLKTRVAEKDLMIHCACAQKIVETYRAENKPITDFWRFAESAIKAMATMAAGDETDCIKYKLRRHAVIANGLPMRYPGLESNGDSYSYRGGYKGRDTVKIYGGSFTENLTQHIARNIIAEQAVEVVNRGHHIVTTTHDELVLLAPEADAHLVLAEVLDVMKAPPAWAKGLPLSAEGGFDRSYGGAK